MKKRIFVLLVTSPLIFTFYGCGSKSDGGNTKLNEGQNINEKKTETEDLETKISNAQSADEILSILRANQ